MQTVTHDGVELAYDVAGPADGEPVVLLSGLGYGRWMWRWQRDRLAEEYRPIRIDNRGAGDSDEPAGPYTIEGMAADVEAVLAAEGVDRAHVVGASMGGMIAQRYALEYSRAKTLTLCCTTHGGVDAVPIPDETQEQMFDTPKGASERELIRHRMRPAFNERFTNRNPHLMDRIIEWRLEQDAGAPAREAQAAAALEFDVSDRLERIRVPTLVMHGTNDRVLPAANGKLLDEKIPETRLELVEGGSHCFFIEDSELVNRTLRSFLEDHE